MKKVTHVIFIAIIIFIVQTACGVGGTATQEQQPTQDVQALVNTSVAQTQAANLVVLPTITSAPVIKLPTTAPVLPTITLAPVITSSVQGTVNYGANCRFGPGANFLNLVILNQGTLVDVIGTAKATDNTIWWLTKSPDNADCWLIDAALTITGDKSSVAVVVSPPTPTAPPPPYWGGTWTYWIRGGFDGATDEGGSINFTQSGNNLSATFYEWGFTFFFNGTISADGMVVNGKLTRDDPGEWLVVFKRNPSNLNQFRGSWSVIGFDSGDGDWCGSINGAAKPNPCKQH